MAQVLKCGKESIPSDGSISDGARSPPEQGRVLCGERTWSDGSAVAQPDPSTRHGSKLGLASESPAQSHLLSLPWGPGMHMSVSPPGDYDTRLAWCLALFFSRSVECGGERRSCMTWPRKRGRKINQHHHLLRTSPSGLTDRWGNPGSEKGQAHTVGGGRVGTRPKSPELSAQSCS